MTSAPRIAVFEPADAAELIPMWHASFEHGVGITDTHSVEQRHEYFLRDVVTTCAVHVAKREGRIVGFMACTPNSVAHLYVRVDCIGQGIGTQLLALAKNQSEGRLWLYAFARNANACRFYQRHGFREVERESENMYKLEAIRYEWRIAESG